MTIKITGLWRQELTNGTTQLVGELSPTAKLLVVPNHAKLHPTDPDFHLIVKASLNPRKQSAPPADLLTALSADRPALGEH